MIHLLREDLAALFRKTYSLIHDNNERGWIDAQLDDVVFGVLVQLQNGPGVETPEFVRRVMRELI